jgi:2-polyprenyl-3-methyl-5-hydroxy-6-metoxy-1,4-benzoquinol methylase
MQHEQRPHATDEITKFYDDVSQDYATAYLVEHSTARHFFRTRQSIVLNILAERGGGTLLDVGCGPGLYSEPSIGLGYQYHGLDGSPGMVYECTRRHRQLDNARYYLGRIEKLPFKENCFDAILCLGVIEYVKESELRTAVSDLHRVLKPRGILIVSLLNQNSPYWLWTVHVYPYLQYLYRNIRAIAAGTETIPVQYGIPTRRFTVRGATTLLRSMQFEIESVRYFGYDLYPPPFDRWLSRRLRRFTPALERFSSGEGRG